MTVKTDNRKVLVVEDDPSIALMVLAQLEKIQCDFSWADNGLMAVKSWMAARGGKPFDLVIMDLNMPVMSGFAATREIRKLEHELEVLRTPILAFSADDGDVARAQDPALGFDAVLHKTREFDQLSMVVVRLAS